MRQTRKCAFCGKEFTSGNDMKKYCCERCAEERVWALFWRTFLTITPPKVALLMRPNFRLQYTNTDYARWRLHNTFVL